MKENQLRIWTLGWGMEATPIGICLDVCAGYLKTDHFLMTPLLVKLPHNEGDLLHRPNPFSMVMLI